MKLNKQRLNSKGFSHIEMILAVVVVVAIAGVGVFVYKHHQDSKKDMNMMGSTSSKSIIGVAHATNWATLVSGYGIKIQACATPVFAGYDVSMLYIKPATFQTKEYAMDVSHPHGEGVKTDAYPMSNAWYLDVAGELTQAVSIASGDTVTGVIQPVTNGGTGSVVTKAYLPSYLPHC
jgi:hypothetical protein